MSRPVLAGLVGYSTDWLKRIETGQRGVSIPALLRLARILRVDDLSVFIDGDTPIPVSAWDGPGHPAVSAVRRIAGPMHFSLSDRTAAAPDVRPLADRVAKAWRDWHTLPNNHSVLADDLPGLVADLETATIVLDGAERRAAQAALASAYGLVQHLAVDMVEPEVSRVIADRTARAAQAADDPVSLAFGAWIYGHAVRSLDADAALRIVAEATAELERHAGDDPDAAGLLGSLNLHMSISAAHQGQMAAAWRLWDRAADLAARLPAGYHHPQTVFGPANVAIHGVSVAAELRQAGEAVARAERIDPDAVPSRERRGRLFGEIAAGHLRRGELGGALHYLEQAFLTSPEDVPYSPLTRGVAVELVRSASGPFKTQAVALAERIGVLPAA